MKQTFIDILTEKMQNAFEKAGYDADMARVQASNRPDLCEFQCNGAMALAKRVGKNPLEIAQSVADVLQKEAGEVFSEVSVAPPGFLNLKASPAFLSSYLRTMCGEEDFGAEKTKTPKTIVLDFGGPNVAKPLHVGHLRSAVIGESIKRILRFHGDRVVGDIHMGDWGLQMGLILTEVEMRDPSLPYFSKDYTGEYPKEAPFTIAELEEIYPTASAKSKEDEAYHQKALDYTQRLQAGERGLRALWEHIIRVSVSDLQKNYDRLSVSFDLWNGESTVQPLIAPMVEKMKQDGFAYESEGALIVDVAKEDDKKEVPPCMILKSDGAALYTTTDLATIQDREEHFHPDAIYYVVDKRQELHFVQVFRCARKCGLLPEETELKHIGFGTVNGKDGKPLKTRDGGVMRLEWLIDDIDKAMLEKIKTNPEIPQEEAEETAKKVALAALKYGDLSNLIAGNYIFDMDKFISFEGDTGPYILYTIVRAGSILKKAKEEGITLKEDLLPLPETEPEKKLMLTLSSFAKKMEEAYEELAPSVICAYLYELANDFNSFYHTTKILSEKNEEKKKGYLALLKLAVGVMETCADLLGFEAPERM